ncbi:MAG: hypothetical protein DRP42_00790 [Tenericutes bacterium]|nr:MAG: hypothetical protein DRP42_00790 [Mycoplasmatota bacterium]
MIGILNKYAREGKLVAHVSMASTISKFTVTTNFIRNQEGFDVLMKKMKLADVLVLDDIGTESPSKFTRDDFLFNILNYRMENNKLTFVTSNASVNEYLNYVSGIVAKSRKEDGLKVDRLKTRINALMNEVHVIGKDRRK